MLTLDQVLEKIETISARRGISMSDCQALKESIKHLDKKTQKEEKDVDTE